MQRHKLFYLFPAAFAYWKFFIILRFWPLRIHCHAIFNILSPHFLLHSQISIFLPGPTIMSKPALDKTVFLFISHNVFQYIFATFRYPRISSYRPQACTRIFVREYELFEGENGSQIHIPSPAPSFSLSFWGISPRSLHCSFFTFHFESCTVPLSLFFQHNIWKSA